MEVIWLNVDGELLPFTAEQLVSAGVDLPRPVIGMCYKATDFISLPLTTAPSYLGNGVLAKRSKAMLYGEPKIGKSVLATQLALDLTTGEASLGIPVKERAKVLYIQCEVAPTFFQDRLRKSGRVNELLFVETDLAPPKLTERRGQAWFIERIGVVRPDVVVIDPLYKLFAGDLNEGKDTTGFISFVDSVVDEFGVTVLIVHHARKEGEVNRGVLQESLGSILWSAWFESIFKLTKVDDGVRVDAELRNSPEVWKPLKLALDRDSVQFVPQQADEVASAIIDALTVPCSRKDLLQQLRVAPATLDRTLKTLVEEGLVEKTERGVYCVVDKSFN